MGAAVIPGWGSVPTRLTKKILALEFVDMWELLPESWRLKLAEAGYEFPIMGGMLRCFGGYPVNVIPREDTTFQSQG